MVIVLCVASSPTFSMLHTENVGVGTRLCVCTCVCVDLSVTIKSAAYLVFTSQTKFYRVLMVFSTFLLCGFR